MTLTQKKLAADILKVGVGRVWIDPDSMKDVKEAITRDDVRNLIKTGAIRAKQKTGISRGRARHTLSQKRKGRQKGHGSRKGKPNARQNLKETWVNNIRLQRSFFKELKGKSLISVSTYRLLRTKSKGGFFKGKRRVKLFLTEKGLWEKKQE